MNNDINAQIKDAVDVALIKAKQADHESRITALEKWKMWLMSGLVYVGIVSSGTLLMLILQKVH